jgi:O-antigen/teichoic acid export membrane protein
MTHNMIVYGVVQLLTMLLAAVWWYHTARTHMQYHFVLPKDWWSITWKSIRDFTLWNQLIGVISRLLYQADIVILGFFVTLAAIGPYSVALTISNVFFVFPQLAQKLVTFSFSQLDTKMNARALGLAVKYNTIICIGQFVVFTLIGKWVIAFFGPAQPEQVLMYALYLVGGVTLFNLSRPWLSLAFAQMSNRKIFFQLFVPLGVGGMVIYAIAAQTEGVLGVARANVLLYLLAGAFSVLYVTYHLRVVPSFELITIQEKKFVSELLSRVKKV